MELHLKQNDELLGTLRSYDLNFPWLYCKFESTGAFLKIKPLFDEELRLMENEVWDEWEEIYQQIMALNLKLIDLENGKTVTEFLLHIQDGEAWFRW